MKNNNAGAITGKAAIFVLAFLFLFIPGAKNSHAADSAEKAKKLNSTLGEKFNFATDRITGNVIFLESKKSENISPQALEKTSKPRRILAAKRFLNKYGKNFGLSKPSSELASALEKEDELGMHHIGFDQVYKGVPVLGGRIIAHLGNGESVKKANGRVVPSVKTDVDPKLTEEEAKAKAASFFLSDYPKKAGEAVGAKLYIFNKNFLENKEGGEDRLVWEVEVSFQVTDKHGSSIKYYIDAHSGDLVHKIKRDRDALNRSVYFYDAVGDLYYGRTEGEPAFGDSDIDDVYGYLGAAHNYFATKFSRNGANNAGGTGDGYFEDPAITAGYTHIDYSGYSDVECPNAYYWGDSVAFCEGMVAADSVGHEYGHSVNVHSVYPDGLIYGGQSGALEEGFADIWGLAIEGSLQGANDWMLGEDIHVSGLPSPLRNVWNPASNDWGYGPFADTMYSPGFFCSDDSFGFYQNSTVLTHAAYLMAAGGTFNGCSINAIGSDKQERILYRALTNYLTPASNFNDLYYNINSSCNDLMGSVTTDWDCQQVKKAVQSAEMDQPGICSGVAKKAVPECAISSNVSSLTYSRSKKAKRIVNLTLNGANLPNKKYIKVRLNGRNVRVRSARNITSGGLISLDLRYNKWSVASYDLLITYKIKEGGAWVSKTATASGILSIVNP